MRFELERRFLPYAKAQIEKHEFTLGVERQMKPSEEFAKRVAAPLQDPATASRNAFTKAFLGSALNGKPNIHVAVRYLDGVIDNEAITAKVKVRMIRV